MIKLFILSLLAIVFALLVTLYLGFPGDPGYLLIAFGNYTFETSLFALLVAAGFIYLFAKLLMLVLHWINPWQLIRYGKNYNTHRKARSRSKTVEGLLALTRGNWQSSYNLLSRSTGDTDATVVNYLAAAYTAYQLGNKAAWTQWLEKAETEYPGARTTINSLKAQLLFKSNQLEQCVAVLEQQKKTALNDASMLLLLKEVYIKLEDWRQLEELLPTLEKNKIVEAEELERIKKRVFMEELYAASSQDNINMSATDRTAQLTRVWKKASVAYKHDEKAVKHYIGLLLAIDAKVEAVKVLEAALSKNWSDELVIAYGDKAYEQNSPQLIQAESWLKSRPANACLLLTLGRICMRNELWGKAREYYTASIKISPSAEAYGELSKLLKSLGEIEASEKHLQNYVEFLKAELIELPLPKVNN